MKIALCNHRNTLKYKNEDKEWSYLVERNRTPVRTAETVLEYMKMTKEERVEAKDVGGYFGGWLKNGLRRSDCVECRSSGELDGDHISDKAAFLAKTRATLTGCTYFIYSTHSHRPDYVRLRIVILFNREVTAEEYPALMRMIASKIGMDYFDDTTYQANRMMFWASCPSDGEFFFEENQGVGLEVDKFLGMYDDWRDISKWPMSTHQSKITAARGKKQADPLTKEGIVGAFCRTYSISEAISAFLSDVYAPTANDNRYDYIPAESTAGVIVYDDKFSYSFHESDPACGKLLNAFDLVRVHLYPDDNETKSFQKMGKAASDDPKVKLTILHERQEQAAEDFTDGKDWQEGLQYESRSTVLRNNLHNLTLILENDPLLADIVFNQQLDGMEIKGKVPWKHPSKFWRDADDAQLITYIDSHYGTFSERNYKIAVTKVADDRSYHPIREFFDALPEWDGIDRVDTLLIDYLGADDNKYVRAVTRKALCGAVCRVLRPGCKFDTMLVLNGPQGVGKSTLIAKLGGEWFSDSLSLSDTKDKTAAEKLQGYWILEIGELAGLRKAEVETLRSFLSRQNDIYRAAFGRRATPHPRQCIFVGTTNAESGYLRDTTGNRRFWPVKTPGNGEKHSWELDENEIQQIWAEVLHMVNSGEKLYLTEAENSLAKDEQRAAMESDEREGLVREYLDTLLPTNWNDMDVYSRRNYMHEQDDPTRPVGSVKRTQVSNMEIWCECFGRERSTIRRSDSNELASILIKLGWVRQPNKVRIQLYGPQYVYVPKGAFQET